jgi:hypothetical protein
VDQKLLHRELDELAGLGSRQSIYGSRAWVDNLDIVAELWGHEGCVNALWFVNFNPILLRLYAKENCTAGLARANYLPPAVTIHRSIYTP